MNLNKYLLIAFRLCISRDYRLARKLRVFDSGYFLERAAEKYRGRVDPLWDYLKMKGSGSDSFQDRDAWQQLADPHPLFDTSFYLLRYFPDGLTDNPLVHYLRKGWREGFWPGPFLDPDTYRARSSWDESQGDPLTHYTHHGALKCISPSPFFDVEWYLDNNPVLAGIRTEIIKHYKLYGARIGKSPIPLFDPDYYLSQLADSTDASEDPLSSYVAISGDSGHSGFRPGRWFDPDYYCFQNDKPCENRTALSHYLRKGVFQKRYTDERIERMVNKPLISILVPVYNPDIGLINNCIRSVLYQVYPHWELCLVDDCSSGSDIRQHLEKWTAVDSRIKVKFHDKNCGISVTTNSAASLAAGEYFGFLDNDDELTSDCLFHVAEAINETGAEIIYSDEDLIGDDGSRFSVFRKPAFNRELLFSHNYITHFVVVSSPLFKKTGGFDRRYDGAQDYDMLLRLSEEARKCVHIPLILYHWRASATSTSINHGQKTYAHKAGKTALEESLKRQDFEASVEETGINFYYRSRFKNSSFPDISVLAWSESGSGSGNESLAVLQQKTSYDKCEFVVVSESEKTAEIDPAGYDDSQGGEENLRIAKSRTKAELLHSQVLASSGEYLLFITSNIIACSDSWLEELVSHHLQNRNIGIVCGRILYNGEDGPSYTVPEIMNDSPIYFARFLVSCSKHMNGVHCPQLLSICDWDFCLISRSLYDVLGGFDYHKFPSLLAMHDLSFRAIETGREIVYTPYASVTIDGKHTGQALTGASRLNDEKQRFQAQWQAKLNVLDPFYNSGLLVDNDIDRAAFTAWLSGNPHSRKP